MRSTSESQAEIVTVRQWAAGNDLTGQITKPSNLEWDRNKGPLCEWAVPPVSVTGREGYEHYNNMLVCVWASQNRQNTQMTVIFISTLSHMEKNTLHFSHTIDSFAIVYTSNSVSPEVSLYFHVLHGFKFGMCTYIYKVINSP